MRIIIIGNGVSGISAAETIRAKDKTSEITIFTSEHHAYYSRPRLIELLANKATVEQITIHDFQWYTANNIELLKTVSVTGIDPVEKKLWDEYGRSYFYDKLVIASGAIPYLPPYVKPDIKNIYSLRTIKDAEVIKNSAVAGRSAVIIGGGLLGLEIASSLHTLGVDVRVIEISGRLLPRQLDHDSSAILQNIFENQGISFRLGIKVNSVNDDNNSIHVNCIDTKTEIADFAVVSAGIQCNHTFFNCPEINRRKGIVVDQYMRTSIPDIYACGDVAEYNCNVYGLWQAGREQGIACGNHILSEEIEYQGTVPSTRLKVAGVNVASIGDIECKNEEQEIVENNNNNNNTYKKLFIRNNKLIGAILIGDIKESGKLQLMIKRGENYLQH